MAVCLWQRIRCSSSARVAAGQGRPDLKQASKLASTQAQRYGPSASQLHFAWPQLFGDGQSTGLCTHPSPLLYLASATRQCILLDRPRRRLLYHHTPIAHIHSVASTRPPQRRRPRCTIITADPVAEQYRQQQRLDSRDKANQSHHFTTTSTSPPTSAPPNIIHNVLV